MKAGLVVGVFNEEDLNTNTHKTNYDFKTLSSKCGYFTDHNSNHI